MQGGPRRGRSPITGPALPRAAQASQASPEGAIECPQGSKYSHHHAGEAKLRAAQASQTPPGGRITCPKGSKLLKPHAEEANPRAAQASQTPPDGGRSCPKGSKNQRCIPRLRGSKSQRMILAAGRQTPTPTPLGKSLSHFFTIQDSPDSAHPFSNLPWADRK